MIRLVVGDTKPDLVFILEQDGVSGSTLTDQIDTVTFKLRKPSGAVVVVPMSLLSASQSKYGGSFAEGDLDESDADAMYGEVIVVFTDGTEQHAERPFEVYVRPEYGDFA